MPRAGFYAIQASKIRFGRDGCWYADDERISNQRIANLFSRHIQRGTDGGYVIRMGDEQARIEVEDTPYVVVAVSAADDALCVELNDGSSEALDATTLEVGHDQVPYCRVKGGRERARFLRPAYYQLARFVSEPEPGQFEVRTGASIHRIRAA